MHKSSAYQKTVFCGRTFRCLEELDPLSALLGTSSGFNADKTMAEDERDAW